MQGKYNILLSSAIVYYDDANLFNKGKNIFNIGFIGAKLMLTPIFVECSCSSTYPRKKLTLCSTI
jgi:hypothetical protein